MHETRVDSEEAETDVEEQEQEEEDESGSVKGAAEEEPGALGEGEETCPAAVKAERLI